MDSVPALTLTAGHAASAAQDAIVGMAVLAAIARFGAHAVIDDTLTSSDDEQPVLEQARRVKSSSLLWFISSRPYVPMADIRRRFGLATETGSLLFDEEGAVHIGLPRQAAETLLDLKRKRKVELQYDLEHALRIAVGAYPLRIRLSPPAPSGRAFPSARSTPPDVAPVEDVEDDVAPLGASAPIPPAAGGVTRPQARRRGRRR
jgi:hypothetical protein